MNFTKQVTLLLVKLKKRDKNRDKVFEELYNLTFNRMLGIARSCLKNKTMAEDAVTITYERIYQYDYPNERTQDGYHWMYRILYNVCISINKKEKYTVTFCEQDLGKEYETIRGESFNVDEWLEAGRVRDILITLPQECQRAVFYKYWMCYKGDEIAEIMNCSRRTIYDLLKKAKNAIKKYL